jgi:hypothetical protein
VIQDRHDTRSKRSPPFEERSQGAGGVLSLADDIAARFEAGADSSVGFGRAQHPIDSQGSWGTAADCQPVAASLSHDYKRHGTTTLFAALEVATGKIIATHSKRRRRVEFSTSLTASPRPFRAARHLHVILDNLNTHKKNEHWLKAHPNGQFHFTPTSAPPPARVQGLTFTSGVRPP